MNEVDSTVAATPQRLSAKHAMLRRPPRWLQVTACSYDGTTGAAVELNHQTAIPDGWLGDQV